MKFGDIIKEVQQGELKPDTLKKLGERYYEKFDNRFSRLFHNHFNLADRLKETPENVDSHQCCWILATTMQQADNTRGWLFEKSLEVLNKVLGTSIERCTVIVGGGDAAILDRSKQAIFKDIMNAIQRQFPINDNFQSQPYVFENASTNPNTRNNSIDYSSV